MNFTYLAFGLCIRSSDPIPGLRAYAVLPRVTDVRVTFHPIERPQQFTNIPPRYISPYLNEAGIPQVRAYQLNDGSFVLVYGDGSEFTISNDGSRVLVTAPTRFNPAYLSTYLVGPVLGYVLRLRGRVPLHASAVAVQGSALVIVGRPGVGKSTTAAALYQAGAQAIADDMLTTREDGEQFWAEPGYPRLRLWPKSSQLLYNQADALPRILKDWDKCELDVAARFAPAPVPLRLIYILRPHSQVQEVSIGWPTPSAAFMKLVSNTYVNYLIDERMRVGEFESLKRIVRHIPIRLVQRPLHISPQLLAKVIREDFVAVVGRESNSSTKDMCIAFTTTGG